MLIAESSNVKAGIYEYKIHIKVGAHNNHIPLRIEVHEVAFAKETPLVTGTRSNLSGSIKRRALETLVRDEMLKNRITLAGGQALIPQKDKSGNLIRPVSYDVEELQNFSTFTKISRR